MTEPSRLRKRPLEADAATIARAADEIDIAGCATIAYSSEDPAHPVEDLFDGRSGPGATRWMSARPDTLEHIVVEFDKPQTIRAITLALGGPVNPFAESILGEPVVPSLDQLPEVLASDERVDIVDVFRRREHIAGIVEACIRLQLPALWLQEGVVDESAAARAVQAGIFTVMDRCLFRERAALRD